MVEKRELENIVWVKYLSETLAGFDLCRCLV